MMMRLILKMAIAACAFSAQAAVVVDGLGFNPEKRPGAALKMYIAPENRVIFKLRQPDGSTREFERDYSRPGALRGARGWRGAYGGSRIKIKSGPNAKGGEIGYVFDKGRLVKFQREGSSPVQYTYDRKPPSLPEEESPLLRALMPLTEQAKEKINRQYKSKWSKSGRLQFPYRNPNRSAMLFSEIALLALSVALFFRRKMLIAGALLVFALSVGCMAWAGSRGAMLGFAAAMAVFMYAKADWIKLMLRRKSTWVVLGLLLAVVVSWLFLQDTNFLSRGFGEGNKGWSNKLRIEIWRNAPMMIVDAPGGWGNLDFQVGRSYLDWYQPLQVVCLTGSLISDHLTRLAAWGWSGRFLYLFGWFAILGCSVMLLKNRRNPFPLAVWVAFGITAWFNPMFQEWTLWIVPALSVLPFLCSRPWTAPRRYGAVAAISAVAATVLLAAIYAVGTSSPRNEVKVCYDNGRALVKSTNPSTWIVDDGITLGGILAWKDVRDYFRKNPRTPSVGCVRDVKLLPEKKIRRLVLAGAMGDKWLKHISKNADARKNLPGSVVFISPPFPPSAIPPPLLQSCKVEFVVGEFATWYHRNEYAEAPAWVKVIPGMELYIQDWMEIATAQ